MTGPISANNDVAYEIRTFIATIPAGTPATSPVTIPLTMPTREVLRIVIRIPPGPAGLMGFALGSAGQPVIPANNQAWIVTADEVIEWDVANQINTGAWELRGYNTGRYDHSVYVRFEVTIVNPLDGSQGLQPLAGATIAASAPPITATAAPGPATGTGGP